MLEKEKEKEKKGQSILFLSWKRSFLLLMNLSYKNELYEDGLELLSC